MRCPNPTTRAAVILCAGQLLLVAAGRSEAAPAADIQQRIVLVGDAGYADRGRALLQQLGVFLRKAGEVPAERTALVYLGDNSYAKGAIVADASGTVPELQQQLDAAPRGSRVIFVPGNHDWDVSSSGRIDFAHAIARLRAEQDYVERPGPAAARWIPRAGCPGPEAVDLGAVKLVAIDSVWWFLDRAERGRMARDLACPRGTEEEVLAALERELGCEAGACPPRVLVAHHPLASHGSHGGYFPWSEHLLCAGKFPIPVGCSAYVAARRRGAINRQDQSSAPYRHFIRSVRGAMARAPALAYAAGHEHTLEVLEDPQVRLLLVSGAGSKPKPVQAGPHFRLSAHGFMVLDFLDEGAVRLRVYAPGEERGPGAPIYERFLDETTPPDANDPSVN